MRKLIPVIFVMLFCISFVSAITWDRPPSEPPLPNTHSPFNILNVTGIRTAGNISSILEIDGITYNLSEVTGTPGYDIVINFTDVDEFNEINLRYVYESVSAHTVNVQLLNFTSGIYDNFGLIVVNGGNFVTTSYPVPLETDYLNIDNVSLRLYHTSPGSQNDDIRIDFASLREEPATSGEGEVVCITETGVFGICLSGVSSLGTCNCG